ncbi:unnamed protein product [Echinostoma caproni]|uniref:Uncharacterized protein n=1 Tax=Echinostoma caproni TaxID=27848 RepID=A0A3P8H9G1_9TREM|nr:unnamed protein product [Echinostoma caproni]
MVHVDENTPITKSDSTHRATTNKIQSSSTESTDSALVSFFSQLPSVDDPSHTIPAQQQLVRRCSWQARSAVTKRTNLFRRANTQLLVDEKTSPTHSSPPWSPPRIAGLTRIPLPGLVPSPPLGPRFPGAQPVPGLFLPNDSLASALLAQRRKVGYTEEELFTAIGTGEQELTDTSVQTVEDSVNETAVLNPPGSETLTSP